MQVGIRESHVSCGERGRDPDGIREALDCALGIHHLATRDQCSSLHEREIGISTVPRVRMCFLAEAHFQRAFDALNRSIIR